MTLNGVKAIILHYFTEFSSVPGALLKNGQTCSHKEASLHYKVNNETLCIKTVTTV